MLIRWYGSDHENGLVLPLTAILCVLLALCSYGSLSKNHLAEFKRVVQHHRGIDVPYSVDLRVGSLWWIAAALVLLFMVSWSVWAGVIIYLLMSIQLLRTSRQTNQPIQALLRDGWTWTFIFLSYPDRRYSAFAGTAAMWIPRGSMWGRRLQYALLLLPFFLALTCGQILFPPSGNGLVSLMAMVMILPVPLLIVTALHLRSLQVLDRQASSAFPPFDNEFDENVHRIRWSTSIQDGISLADHYFLGYVLPSRETAWHPFHWIGKRDLPSRTPALLHDSACDGHIHFVGPTTFGKSLIGQAGISIQVIRGNHVPDLDRAGNVRVGLDGEPLWRQSDPSPMMFLDLKGDIALFNTIREEIANGGRQTFKFFTLEQGKATSHFNFLTNLNRGSSPLEAVEAVLNALDLYHGFFYGGGYYSEMSRNLLMQTIRKAPTRPQSWEELYQLLNDTLDRSEHRDVFELLGRIYALAQYPALGTGDAGADVIDMREVIEQNQCVYFWLPALVSAMSIIGVAKMALFAYMDAARAWNNSGKPRKAAWCFMDEAQVICGQNIDRVIQQASGSKIRLVLSNQTLANLDTRDAPNMSRTIWTNTRVRQAFGLLDPKERDQWIDLSGEEVGCLYSYGRQTTAHQVVHPRLSPNAINAVNNTPGASLLHLTRDAGLSQFNMVPRQIWTPYPMTQADYQRRSSTPWPDQAAALVRGRASATTVVNAQAPAQVQGQAVGRYAALEDLFDTTAAQSGRR